jgi:hypothetical protein
MGKTDGVALLGQKAKLEVRLNVKLKVRSKYGIANTE